MTSEKLAALIEKEEANLDKLLAQKAAVDEKVKKTQTKLQELKMMQNNERFNALSGAVQKSGLSMDDIFSALQNGDLLSLQEKIEQAAANLPDNEEETTAEIDGEEREYL